MDFSEAVEFSKKFPIYCPKIFIGFAEWGICDAKTDGYVVFADAALTKKPGLNELEDYVRSHKLRIDYGGDYLMISTFC
ncbi:MAG: hypothetical protein ABSF44_12685 [Candidatus Bathyarchaeia archaeon]|jgi:hypothetical protein